MQIERQKMLQPGQVRFRVHGPDPDSDELSADVFAAKLGTLVKALKAADRALNGKLLHDYKIARLHSSTPTAVLSEKPIPKYAHESFGAYSGITGFDECAAAILLGDRKWALRYGTTAKHISALARGSAQHFGYMEVWTKEESIVRVDPLLNEQARAVVERPRTVPVLEPSPHGWFKGIAHGTFDGEVRAVDLRGALPEIKLILSAGGKQIDCVFREEDIETVRSALNRRVRVSGQAIYDGRSGLPRRVEITDIEPLSPPGDFTRWKGAFEAFESPEWEADDT